jgi:hypothetical protein
MRYGNILVATKPSAKVIIIEPAQNALSMKEVDKPLNTAFQQIYALKVVDRFVVNSLTHELTAARVTAFFRGTRVRSGGVSQNLNREFVYHL